MNERTATRVGSKLIITETRTEEAIIEFQDILDAAQVVEDDDYRDPPWELWDGYEHELVEVQAEFDREGRFQRYCNPTLVVRERGRDYQVVLTPDTKQLCTPNTPGLSKQARFEKAALCMKQTIKQIVRWRNDGWEWWGVTCTLKEAHDSLWGIDDYSYAHGEVRMEIALQVASELEDLGYEVQNLPPRKPTREQKQEMLRRRIAYQLGYRGLAQYRRWLEDEPVSLLR